MLSTKRLSGAAAAAAMTLALAACGGAQTGSDQSGTLTLGALLAPSTFAANAANWGNESPYLQAAYDTLLRESPDAKIEPWLATSWSYDSSKTVLTMKLRNDVTFTDGTKFDATAAAKNVLRLKDASANKSNLAAIKTATAVDSTTLRITLTVPEPALLHYLAQNAGLMESPKHFGASDEKTNPVGSGPYILDSGATVAGSKYVFTKNPDYWAKDEQRFTKVVIGVYTTQAAVNALQGKQIDGAQIDPDHLKQVKAAGYGVQVKQHDWTGLLLLDRDGKLNPALGKVQVRQAINYAIDRAAILKTVHGYGTVTGQVFAKNDPAYIAELDDQYAYNPAKAKQLLAAAGYPKGFTLPMPLIQGVSGSSQFDLIKEYLGAVGIKVDYAAEPVNNLIADLLAPKFAASKMSLNQDPTAWQTANVEIAPSAAFNPFHTQDPKVDQLLETMRSGSETEALAAARQLNHHVVDQAWFAPFYRVDTMYAVSKNIEVTQQSDNVVPYLYSYKPKA
ncbi:ABC transporter substrate-binding protein [Streptomyces sp. NPDC101234]|uniref:ABC transporter substrate-binding protein n=1 Tax=Streptomyces sp. NPDC101234 TaxID=3366138 RepID=UPI00381146E4